MWKKIINNETWNLQNICFETKKKEAKNINSFGPEGVTNRLKYDFSASNLPTL